MSCLDPRVFRGAQVSCGKCLACLKVKQWRYMARMVAEASISPTLFVTLTLRAKMAEAIGYKLVQRFLKRLRRTGVKVRYAAVAEHGGKRGRLHFHLLLHGHGLSDRKVRKHWSGGISHTSRVGTTGASRVVRYGSKMAGYATKGGVRFRFSQGYGSYALKVMEERFEPVFAAFPRVRVVRIGGVRLPYRMQRRANDQVQLDDVRVKLRECRSSVLIEQIGPWITP